MEHDMPEMSGLEIFIQIRAEQCFNAQKSIIVANEYFQKYAPHLV